MNDRISKRGRCGLFVLRGAVTCLCFIQNLRLLHKHRLCFLSPFFLDSDRLRLRSCSRLPRPAENISSVVWSAWRNQLLFCDGPNTCREVGNKLHHHRLAVAHKAEKRKFQVGAEFIRWFLVLMWVRRGPAGRELPQTNWGSQVWLRPQPASLLLRLLLLSPGREQGESSVWALFWTDERRGFSPSTRLFFSLFFASSGSKSREIRYHLPSPCPFQFPSSSCFLKASPLSAPGAVYLRGEMRRRRTGRVCFVLAVNNGPQSVLMDYSNIWYPPVSLSPFTPTAPSSIFLMCLCLYSFAYSCVPSPCLTQTCWED